MASTFSTSWSNCRVVRAKQTNDPPAYWKEGRLHISVQRAAVDLIELTEADHGNCIRLATVNHLSLERVISNQKLLKAGFLLYSDLKSKGQFPPSPLETSLHRRETELVVPEPGSSESSSTKLIATSRRSSSASEDSPSDNWIQAAYKLYGFAAHDNKESFRSHLASSLVGDIVGKPGTENRHISLRQADLVDSLDLEEASLEPHERLQATARRALQKKLRLLQRLGLISLAEEFQCRVKDEDFDTALASVIDVSQIYESADESDGGEDLTEESAGDDDETTGRHREEPDQQQQKAMAVPPVVAVTAMKMATREMDAIDERVTQHAADALDVDDIAHLKGRLADCDKELREAFEKIIGTVGLPEADVTAYQEKQFTYRDKSGKIAVLLKKIKRTLAPTEGEGPQRDPNPPPRSVKLSLPKIQIPTFKGTWQDWLSFKDIMQTTVIDQPDDQLPDIHKFQLLRQSLDGDALKLIKSIPMTGENLDRAWKALCDRYDNGRRLKAQYMDEITNVRPLDSASATQLRALFAKLDDCRQNLEKLKVPTEGLEELFVQRLLVCFDWETRTFYETVMCLTTKEGGDKSPGWEEMRSFVNARCMALKNATLSRQNARTTTPMRKSTAMTTQKKESGGTKESRQCLKCSEQHPLWKCEQFKKMQSDQRREFVREKRLCFICLATGHRADRCRSKTLCRTCEKKHNSLLHIRVDGQSSRSGGSTMGDTEVQACVANKDFSTVILPTARVWVQDPTEELHPYRALLDTGSQSTFISERAVQFLRLKRKHVRVQVTGIGNGAAATCKGYVNLCIRSIVDPSVEIETAALILPTVTGNTPNQKLPTEDWSHLNGLQLADPDFGQPGKVDIVLGADVSFRCLTGNRLLGRPNEPVAHSTSFGWVVGGTGNSLVPVHRLSANVALHEDVPISVLNQFWGVEGLSEEKLLPYQKDEDKLCEEIFMATTTRLEDGKLQVCFPFKNDPPAVGPSKSIAIRRLAGTEARLTRNPGLRKQYEDFMDDYENQGHMVEVKTAKVNDVFLPHHPIVRTTALTTKLRVVFDASAKTANGYSLNSQQLVGPVIQDDLFSILARFRLHRIAINGDIAQMYRQIWIHPDHQDYQRVLWRRKVEDPISEFRLKTVTYGTASAPWLATRSLKWIADNEKQNHPEAARIIAQDHYVDDLLSGADTAEDAHRIQYEVSKVLLSYGLPLRKWASNDECVIRAITGDQAMLTNPEEIVKTLGLKWNSKSDSFQFKVKLKEVTSLTKRAMISEIACTFDPLGFAAPVIVLAKMLYQQVWTTKTDWDDLLPLDIATRYQEFRQKLPGLERITPPRWLGTVSADEIELHGFSDASEKAYAAAVYLRVLGPYGTVSNLVAAKTRVAPLSTVSLPRLELMGAVLVTELMNQVTKAFRRLVKRRFYWTDSTITLAWIKSQPSRFKTFIANRVSAIQELSDNNDWRHVGTKDNPSDLASRGIMPHELTGEINKMWFNGPTWLRDGTLPAKVDIPEAKEECKKIQSLYATTDDNAILELMEKTSSFNRLWRVTAWILRYITNYRMKKRNPDAKLNLASTLNSDEKQEAFQRLIYVVQQQSWFREIKALTSKKTTEDRESLLQVMKKSSINNLNPILDEQGILRVGGRLENSNREFASKHPAILPYGHLAKIYLHDLHVKNLHAGPTLLLATARQQVWIQRGPQLARDVVKKCIDCIRWKGETLNQQMGNLPRARTEGLRAFNTVGVDYAWPMLVKNRKGRGASTTKAWISVFVCFSTKAVHLELVSELTSEAFIAALRRFIARRGLPREIHSDNGTNFVGADKELQVLLMQQQTQQDLIDASLQQGITWKFIPPSAPHQGGLWESAVKSVKYHLCRVLGAATLTFEEFATVLCQIEAQLNSRPLCPLTEDVSDVEILTPGHFLVGQPLNAAPDPNLAHLKENRLGRWQYLQRLQQEFWAKWHLEYLSTLQKRNKWKHPQEDLKLGALVIVKEDNIAPMQWRRGRVITLHPGKDGKTRVVTLKTNHGDISRPIVKLIKLF